MNLRVLKKLCKRAAPYLPRLGDGREQFPAKRGESYTGVANLPRKQWCRSTCHPSWKPYGREIVFTTRSGRSMIMRPEREVLPGTIMVGGMSGYYEPEWDEETAWEALVGLAHAWFTDWEKDAAPPTRSLRTPAEVFAAAEDMVREYRFP